MNRSLVLLSSAALFAAAVNAQCPQGTDAGLVQWSASASYTATFPADDEGISNPPIALPFAFPMPGVAANLDQLWVNSNGEIYLSDSTAGQIEPLGGALFGVSSFAEMQGAAGSNPRIVVFGADQRASIASGAAWSVTVDTTSVAGQATVTWNSLRRFSSSTDNYAIQATLFSTGAVQFDYAANVSAGTTWVGVSVGNLEPSTSGSQDLTTLPVSAATEGILYQNLTTATFDLAGQSVLIVPDLTPGIENYAVASVTPYVAPSCAKHETLGVGCHSFSGPDTSNLFELFPDSPSAKAALDGNALQFTLSGSGYTANWIAGGATGFVAPSGSEILTGLGDDDVTTITPSVAAPVPGGVATDWTISSNGVVTAGSSGNQGTSFSPSLSATASQTGLAFYVWRDWNPAEGGSGPIVYEEIGGVLYITWNGVEAYGSPSPNPGTHQYQIDLTTGDVTLVWVSFEASTSTADVLVGCTLAGSGPTPVSTTLSSVVNQSVVPPVSLSPMTLSAAPRPVINPSTLVTYSLNNVVEAQPSTGIYLSTMFLSVNPLPGGFDLTGILTTVSGCNAYIGSLDLDLGAQVTAGPTASWAFTFDNVAFAPGNVIAAQAVALFDPAFPLVNGEAGGFLFSNGVQSTTEVQ